MKKNVTSLTSLAILAVWASLFLPYQSSAAKESDYPAKPITFYIHYNPGGATDVALRPLLEAAGKHLGQPFVPVNKPGGAGLVGAIAVMNSKPDGYTLGSCAGSNALVMPFLDESPYKDLSRFTFICNYGKFLLPVTVKNDAPFKTWEEFIEWARKNPRRAAKVAVLGSRTQSPNAMILWKIEQKERVEFSMIVFKGNVDSLTALLGGHITMDAGGITPQTIESIKEGKLRLLAFMGKEKMPGFENIPSFYDVYGIVPPSIMGIWGPNGLPPYAVKKLEDAFSKAVNDTTFINVMSKMYMPVVYVSRTQLEQEVKEELPKVGEIIKALMAQEAKERKQ